MPNLRFILRGEGKDDDLVDASDFSSFLRALLACLGALEEETAAQAPVEYRITGLEIGSAAIELEPISTGDLNKSAEAVSESFSRGFAALQNDGLLRSGFTRKTQSRFLDLTKPLRHATRAIEFGVEGGQPVRITRASPIRALPEVKVTAVSQGSVKGAVDALNVHSQPLFYVYPKSGPKRVRCSFPVELLDDLREAIKRNTTVYGLMEFQGGSPFPTELKVERVEVHPPDSELPRLASLWGTDPRIASGRPATEFVQALRDG